ncbi:IS66 family insertion sequence element accessory protein TnpB [Agrobacterium pusense]|uniref:IS66 family insertion sequence element accessory protein TnpB n=1 Tax=Agrobacterium pusense TaxID=648995 RepID=UPI0039C9A42D
MLTPVRIPRPRWWPDQGDLAYGQGACLSTKKFERGRFIWPSAVDDTMVIMPAQLGYLLEGIDRRMPRKT